MFSSLEDLSCKLTENGYLIDPVLMQVVFLAAKLHKPLLLEGPAGSGKTQLALSVAAGVPDLLWFPTILFYETGYSLHTLRQASRRSWRIGQRHPVRVKFLIYDGTAQRTCLRLMGKKMLVALMMEGKFSGEGLHSMEADEDMLAAMARELVEKGGVGESADAVWQELRGERIAHLPASVMPEADMFEAVTKPEAEMDDLFAGSTFPAPGPVLVHSEPKKKTLWPTGLVAGDQLKLFG